MTASSAKDNPAEDRDVVESADHSAASQAARARMHQRLMPRQPRDADVEEAAKGEPEEDNENGDQNFGHAGSEGRNRSLSFALPAYAEALRASL